MKEQRGTAKFQRLAVEISKGGDGVTRVDNCSCDAIVFLDAVG